MFALVRNGRRDGGKRKGKIMGKWYKRDTKGRPTGCTMPEEARLKGKCDCRGSCYGCGWDRDEIRRRREKREALGQQNGCQIHDNKEENK